VDPFLISTEFHVLPHAVVILGSVEKIRVIKETVANAANVVDEFTFHLSRHRKQTLLNISIYASHIVVVIVVVVIVAVVIVVLILLGLHYPRRISASLPSCSHPAIPILR
jgi:hypothetical protein